MIPARNEAGSLPGLFRELFDTDLVRRGAMVILVDDGSEDETSSIAAKAGALVLRQPTSLGKGSALLTGCDRAVSLGADLIAVMDADGQHPPNLLDALVLPLVEGNADVVLGRRSFSGEMPALYRFGNRTLNSLLKALYGVSVGDSQCGFRAFTASAYSYLRWDSAGYAVESELLVRLSRAGLRHAELAIPTIYHDDRKGTQPADGLAIAGQLLRWRFWRAPGGAGKEHRRVGLS